MPLSRMVSVVKETRGIQNAEGAVLGTLTALVYTFQMIFGVGTAISFLSVVPLVYGLSDSKNKWVRISSVAMLLVFVMNGIGAFLFFVLFILPMSISVFLKTTGMSTFVSAGPLFWSLVLILSKFGLVVGFTIPPQLKEWWLLLAFMFCVGMVLLFSKIALLVLKPFDFQPELKIPKFEMTIFVSTLNLATVFSFYGLSDQTFLILAFMAPLVALEPLKYISLKTEKALLYTLYAFRNRFL